MYIIAEIGINHNGDMATAERLIRMAAECGVDCVKFQKRDIDTVYTKEFLDSLRESPWGTTQRKQKEKLEFSFEQHRALKHSAESRGLDYLCSSWDLKSLELIDSLEPKAHKVASPMLTNILFLEAVNSTGKPVIISTGMSSLHDIDVAVEILEPLNITIMQCTSIYPCPDEKANVCGVKRLKRIYPAHRIGFSSHCTGILAPTAAAATGAEVIEVHITLDRAMYGSDQSASLERRGLELLVKNCRSVKSVLGSVIAATTLYAEEIRNAEKLRYWE